MTPLNESKEEEGIVSGVAKRDLLFKSETGTERDLTSLSQKVRSKRSILSHKKEANESSNVVLDANFEWLKYYFRAVEEVKRTILSKLNVKNPATFKEWVQAATEYLITYNNENPLPVLYHVAGCSNIDTSDLSDKPGDQIVLEFSQENTCSKYLSQGLFRMFGPDFIKRPDVSEWLNKEILTDFKQFVANNYTARP